MNVESNFTSQRRQFGKRRHGNGDLISDTASLNNDQIRPSRYQFSTEVSNHTKSSNVGTAALGCRFERSSKFSACGLSHWTCEQVEARINSKTRRQDHLTANG